MSAVIRVAGLVGIARDLQTDDFGYLQSYDLEAHDGQGDLVLTKSITHAKRFKNIADAIEFALRVPSNRPIRSDGHPNRPLRAFNLMFESVDDLH